MSVLRLGIAALINHRLISWRLGAALVPVVALAGCGGGGGPASTPPPPTAVTPTPTPAPTPAPAVTPTPTPAAVFDTAEYRRSDGPAFHNAVPAWQLGATGKGVTIGIVDTGIDPNNAEFAGRISAASADVAGNRGITPEDGHGTQVALVAAAARNDSGVVGIAWDATVMALRADSAGTCATQTASDPESGCRFGDTAIGAGIDRAVQNGAKVINLSLGGDGAGSQVTSAITRAANAGAVVVVSAGNDGDSTKAGVDPNDPELFAQAIRAAGNGNVIIAGSVDDTGTISTFSNRAGTEANAYLAALGDAVCCLYENGTMKITTDSSGQRFVTLISGTSFSAPQIAGAAALLRQAFPNLTGAQVVNLLLSTARDAGAAGADPIYGRGILDIGAAFAPQGTTTLAGTATAVALGGIGGTLSQAMGDAGGQSLSSIVLDSYGRAYKLNLAGNLSGAALPPRLTAALAQSSRQVAGGNDKVAMAFTVDRQRRDLAGPLSLRAEDVGGARVLAARVIARIAPHTQLGFAYSENADGLAAQVQGRDRPAFMVAGSPVDDLGFARRTGSAVAVRQAFGRWGLTVTGESGEQTSGDARGLAPSPGEFDRNAPFSRFGLQLDRQWSRLSLALGAGLLSEQRTVLGARLGAAFGQTGADTIVLDGEARWHPADGWSLGGAWRQAYTRAHTSGLIEQAPRFVSNGWALDALREGVFQPADSLGLRVSQPLRVASGGLSLNLPVAYDYDTLQATYGEERLSLVPHGREISTELAWHGALWGGNAMASLYYRKDPGNYASLPDDKGAAVSWSSRF